MISSHRSLAQILLALGIGIFAGCCCGGVIISALVAQPAVVGWVAPSPTITATPLPRVFATITLAPQATRTATPAPFLPPATSPPPVTVTSVVTATRTPIIIRSTPYPVMPHFMLARPVPLGADRTIPAPTYLYGTTSRGDYDVHHGEEFVNPTGTQALAVGDAVVVTAGNDTTSRLCGDDGKKTCGRDINYYGNLVVLQMDRDFNGQRVFALYGHLNRILVKVGDRVKPGDVVGEIGMTGIALGPHLHFEVRLGVNDYTHTRNPILWMTPLQGRGALAGRLIEKGALVRGATVNLYRADPETLVYATETYSRDEFPPVNSDDEMNENFTFPDLTPGDYIIRIANQQYATRITVEAGKLVFVELGSP